jgi:heme exporter protein CcmD
MQHGAYILAAYAVTLGGLFLMLGLSWRRMAKAERAVEDQR